MPFSFPIRVVTPHHIDNTKYTPVPDRIGQRLNTAEMIMDILHRKADFCFNFIGRNVDRLPFERYEMKTQS